MAAIEADWSVLPKELLCSISRRLHIVDKIHFGAVCNSWNSAASDQSYPPASQLPWLMIPYSEDEEGKETRKFFNLSDNKNYRIKLPKEIRSSKCVGSSFGWLVIVDILSRVLLLNPFSSAIIHLPPTETFPDVLGVSGSESSGKIDYYRIHRRGCINRECSVSPARLRVVLMSKALVTADPLIDNNYMVMTIGFSGLAFCKAGADSWTLLDPTTTTSSGCQDILYLNGLLYVLHDYGTIVAWDVSGNHPTKATKVSPPLERFSLGNPQPYGDWFIRKRYLVESLGNVYQVLLWFLEREECGRNPYGSASCSVYKLDQGTKTWIEVASLRDRVLFLGRNCSISLSAYGFPELRGNSVYFAEYFWKGWSGGDPAENHWSLGVSNLEERKFVNYCSCDLQRIRPPLVWVAPNFP